MIVLLLKFKIKLRIFNKVLYIFKFVVFLIINVRENFGDIYRIIVFRRDFRILIFYLKF